jgi:hypothetical protein
MRFWNNLHKVRGYDDSQKIWKPNNFEKFEDTKGVNQNP